MSVITIPISDKNREVLQLLAERAGKSAEEFLQSQVEELLTASNTEFNQAADYVLKKKCGTLSASGMIRYLTVDEVIELHSRVIEQTGGLQGIRDNGALDSALAQPQMTFDGQELYPSLTEKAGTICYSLICNHPFLDGNKRIGHATTEVFLILNGWEITGSIDEQERIIMELASGTLTRSALTSWLQSHMTKWPK